MTGLPRMTALHQKRQEQNRLPPHRQSRSEAMRPQSCRQDTHIRPFNAQ